VGLLRLLHPTSTYQKVGNALLEPVGLHLAQGQEPLCAGTIPGCTIHSTCLCHSMLVSGATSQLVQGRLRVRLKTWLIVPVRCHLGWATLRCGWMSSPSYVRNVSITYVVAGDSAQSAGSDICAKDVGHMGTEPAGTRIPHRIDYRTVLVLCMGYALLTQAVGGLCSVRDHDAPAFPIRSSWYVASFHPPI
jgi:hypothetical protein